MVAPSGPAPGGVFLFKIKALHQIPRPPREGL
jgi:hypothetical protein